jgi:hypothetical protein
MDVPQYLQILWSYKWLLAFGLVVAVAAALLAGFTIKDGAIESRATVNYTAATTVLVGSQNQPLYQSEIPGQPVQVGVTPPVKLDLVNTAVVYAYLISGGQTQSAVEEIVGPLADDESITAVRRTTQPGGNEAFPGRLALPILSIVGISTDPKRAEEISQAANQVFQEYVKGQQDAAQLPPEQRVELTTIKESAAVAAEGSNPAIPIVVTGVGVFLIFIARAFVLYNAKMARQRRRSKRSTRRASATVTSNGQNAITEDSVPGRRAGSDELDPFPGDDRAPALTGSTPTS